MDTPVIKAILTCDTIIQDTATKKRSIIGIFEKIQAKKFPAVHPWFGVYVKVTNVLGKYKFKLELRDLGKDIVLGFGEIPEFVSDDKLVFHELAFMLGGLRFEHAGKYEFRVLANGDVCENGTKTFIVGE